PSSVLHVRLNDPGKLAHTKSAADPSPTATLLMGVFASGGRFYPLRQKGSDTTGSDHEIAVPFDRPFAFTAIPIGLQLVDNSNKPLDPAGYRLSLTHDSAAPPPPPVLTLPVTRTT